VTTPSDETRRASISRARSTVEHYATVCDSTPDTLIVDLVVDLLHLEQHDEEDALWMVSLAQRHFLCEWIGALVDLPDLPELVDLKNFYAVPRDGSWTRGAEA
jgi:hypothetical protein